VSWDVEDVHSANGTLGEALYRAGGRYFRIGYIDSRRFGGAVVWTSKDAETWTRVRSTSFRNRAVGGLVESPTGTFAFGRNALPGTDSSWGFIVWPVRPDGSFGAAHVVDLGSDQRLIANMTWTGGEFLAWGGSRGGYWPQRRTTVLASSDAMSWTFMGEIQLAKAGSVSAVAQAGDLLVAIGNEGRRFPLHPRAWTSRDAGRTWRPAEVPTIDARMSYVDAGGRGLIARGLEWVDEAEVPMSWTTRTGRSWTELPYDQDLPRVLGFRGLDPVTIGKRTCVAGSIDVEPTRGAIYCR
jgi:hypothetical protein